MMAQAQPQFTPVQILEAGERAMADGRTEYAAQFFQHLLEHYANTPEAAGAREAMARLNGDNGEPQAPQINYANGQSNGSDANGHAPVAVPPPVYARPANAAVPRPPAPVRPNGYANGANGTANARSNGGANGGANGAANGHNSPSLTGMGPAPAVHRPGQRQTEPAFGRPPQALERDLPSDMPRHLARHSNVQAADPAAQATQHRHLVPAAEKNYIIGRVLAGLVLFIGIAGIFVGIVLVYAALSDPSLYGRIGMAQPDQALLFSGAVFLGSVVLLIAAQIATALFDGADAVGDLARLERFRAGDFNEDED